jgi:hypothetical protein
MPARPTASSSPRPSACDSKAQAASAFAVATLLPAPAMPRSSGTARAPALASRTGRRRTLRRSSSTRSVTCPPRYRASSCACWKSARSNGWGARGRFQSTHGSSRPRTAISNSGSPTARSARICSTPQRLPDTGAPVAGARRRQSPARLVLRGGILESIRKACLALGPRRPLSLRHSGGPL